MSPDAAPPVPRYRAAADRLERRIVAGELSPHAQVPSERVVADELGISRMTARQAIELLVRRGLVYRRPGAGTFVSPPRIEHTLQRLAGFSDQMRSQGIEPSGRVLGLALVADVAPEPARALGLRRGAKAWILRRVRFGDGEPLLLETSFVPNAVCPRLGRHDLARESLYGLMRSEYGVVPRRAHEEIDPTTLEPDDAAHLDARAGSPAIRVTRTTYAADDSPIEYAVDMYRGDRARFVVDLRNA